MLRVVGATEAKACSVAIDDYVPLSWRCADTPAPLYWRTGDLDSSLLEIGLVPESGMLCKVTIVLASGCLRQDDSTAGYMASAQRRDGLPCCDTRPWLERIERPDMSTWEDREGSWMFDMLRWEDRIMDEAGPFTIAVGPVGASVWLGDPLPLTVCYVTPALRCGIGPDGVLRLLHVDGLSDDERAHIVATITGSTSGLTREC